VLNLQLKYLQSNTHWRIVQCPIARWQCLFLGLCSEYQTALIPLVIFCHSVWKFVKIAVGFFIRGPRAAWDSWGKGNTPPDQLRDLEKHCKLRLWGLGRSFGPPRRSVRVPRLVADRADVVPAEKADAVFTHARITEADQNLRGSSSTGGAVKPPKCWNPRPDSGDVGFLEAASSPLPTS